MNEEQATSQRLTTEEGGKGMAKGTPELSGAQCPGTQVGA